jgi:hypothetical protein
MLQPGRSRVLFLMKSLDILNLCNLFFSRTIVLASTQLVTEMSTRNLHRGGGKMLSARKADNLIAI